MRQEVAGGEIQQVLIERSRTAQLVAAGARSRGCFAGLLLGPASQAPPHHGHGSVVVVRGPA
ncbi:universal stress protein [Streptomyces sp. NPDC094143]|uniref:universal stress protein n=1 Tax=Streptomyces sp. NPDC094143 TaxID=3155310 RepID=UPI003327EDF0